MELSYRNIFFQQGPIFVNLENWHCPTLWCVTFGTCPNDPCANYSSCFTDPWPHYFQVSPLTSSPPSMPVWLLSRQMSPPPVVYVDNTHLALPCRCTISPGHRQRACRRPSSGSTRRHLRRTSFTRARGQPGTTCVTSDSWAAPPRGSSWWQRHRPVGPTNLNGALGWQTSVSI